MLKLQSGFFKSNSTILEFPDWTAKENGVSPINSFAFTFKLLCDNMKEIISFVQYKIAQWIG